MSAYHTVVSSIIFVATLGMCGVARAQRQDSNAAAVDAIHDAVLEGHNPYRRATDEPISGDAFSPECQELLAEFNATPHRSYQATGPTIQTSQGRVVPGLQRDRARDDLLDTFREKCMH
ncbi:MULTISPECIES: hypothetical protein [Cupriavidus]|uniref:hypothetical protein n=1 Tax=Cupriavidus TaxID=106589 RepID=UPI0005792804|nr:MULTISPECIES: hypothetical protein [Cupriavidus]KWR74212.1 hypothetical protein RN01_30915 [Cupriavidus sp. SHE]QWC87686.1 hypothetical protein KB891_11580 [Cupriavidus metallidurans]